MSAQTISVPTERFRQLQALADQDGVSIVEVIVDFINEAVAIERIPDTIPGWIIEKRGGDMFLAVEDTSIERTLKPKVAASLAEELDRLATPGAKSKAILDLDANLKLERRGTSVKITDIDTGEERAVARSVVKDLSRLLRGRTRATI